MTKISPSDMAAARRHHPDWFRVTRTVYAKAGCLTCGGAGASVPLEEAMSDDYCDCVLDQLITEAEHIALADGLITVEAADA